MVWSLGSAGVTFGPALGAVYWATPGIGHTLKSPHAACVERSRGAWSAMEELCVFPHSTHMEGSDLFADRSGLMITAVFRWSSAAVGLPSVATSTTPPAASVNSSCMAAAVATPTTSKQRKSVLASVGVGVANNLYIKNNSLCGHIKIDIAPCSYSAVDPTFRLMNSFELPEPPP